MQAVELWPARDHCGPSGTPADKRLWQRAAVMHPTARWVEPLRMGDSQRFVLPTSSLCSDLTATVSPTQASRLPKATDPVQSPRALGSRRRRAGVL